MPRILNKDKRYGKGLYDMNNYAYYAFRGSDQGWAQSNYVVLNHPLDPDKYPNYYAQKSASDTIETLIRSVGTSVGPKGNPRDSMMKFLGYIDQMANAELDREREFLKAYIPRMSASGRSEEWILRFEDAINNNDFSSAFTMMYSSDKELDRLKTEKFQDIQHTYKLWDAQIPQALANHLASYFENNGEEIILKATTNPNLTINDIVNDFIVKFYEGYSMNLFDSRITDSLKQVLQDTLGDPKLGFSVNTFNTPIFNMGKSLNQAFGYAAKRGKGTKALTRKYNGEVQKVSMETIMKSIENGFYDTMQEYAKVLGAGMGQEQKTHLSGLREGQAAIQTGELMTKVLDNFKRDGGYLAKSIQGKADEILFVSMDLDLQSYANELVAEMRPTTEAELDKIRQLIVQQAQQSPTSQDVFEVIVSVKSYRSQSNKFGGLQLGSGSFYAMGNRLKALNGNLIQVGGGNGLSFFDKLIFLLNNTMTGAAAERYKDEIGQYIGAVMFTWMFDDYQLLLDELDTKARSTKKIHIFNSGGIYATAGEMMQTVSQEMQSQLMGIGANGMLSRVRITPPNPNVAQQAYTSARDANPYNGNESFEQAQNVLQTRWDAVRDAVMASGKLDVRIDQKELSKLLDKLRVYLQ